MALHDYILCCLVIHCYPFCIKDCNLVIVTEGANVYEWFCMPGKICALRALSGRLCCGSKAMWVDLMISPFKILIGIGLFAIRLSTHGVFVAV